MIPLSMYCVILILNLMRVQATRTTTTQCLRSVLSDTACRYYHVYAKSLVERGLAYPCFCTEEELEEVRKQQEEAKELTGYYGKYATCRNLSDEEIEANIKAGKPYVLRLRSQGSQDKEIVFVDEIKGEVKLPENIHDIVLLKKDGIPTYHFAHAIDDHLMRTTVVVRGGEWLASAPIHYELSTYWALKCQSMPIQHI